MEKIFANHLTEKGLLPRKRVRLSQQQKDKKLKFLKWALDFKRHFLSQKWYTTGQQAHGRVLNLSGHYENPSQNYNEIVCHIN